MDEVVLDLNVGGNEGDELPGLDSVGLSLASAQLDDLEEELGAENGGNVENPGDEFEEGIFELLFVGGVSDAVEHGLEEPKHELFSLFRADLGDCSEEVFVEEENLFSVHFLSINDHFFEISFGEVIEVALEHFAEKGLVFQKGLKVLGEFRVHPRVQVSFIFASQKKSLVQFFHYND